MIQNIIFDMGGVLIHFDPRRFVELLGLPEEDGALLLREVFGSVEWVQMDRGSIEEAAAIAAMRENLPERLHGAAERLVNGWWKLELRQMEGMEELLAELKALGYGLYLLSNATVRQPEYFSALSLNRYFDGRLISAFYKLLKPQHEIFETLLREFGLRAEECFFVDDSSGNVEGARYAGIGGAIFDGDVGRLRRALRKAGVPVKVG